MALTDGIALMSSQYTYNGSGPFDAKMLISTFSELSNPDTWKNIDGENLAYNGMIVAVWRERGENLGKNGIYFLHDGTTKRNPDVTSINNWHKLAEISDLAALEEKIDKLPIDELALKTQNIEAILNGTENAEGLAAQVANNTAAIAAITAMSTKIVDTVPSVEEAKPGVIYLVADEKASGSYIEYILVDDGDVKVVEPIGSTAIDLTGYVTTNILAAELVPYAKASEVIAISTFEEFKKSNDSDILAVATEVAKKADIVDLESYYKIQDADAKFISAEDLATQLNSKADKDTTYTKTEVNDIQAALVAQVNAKADAATTYTKAEVNALLKDLEGGSSETADSVARDLAAYISENNAAVLSLENKVGTAKAGEIPATGLFARIDNTQAQVNEVADIISEISVTVESTNAKLNGISTTVVQAIEDAIQAIPPLAAATAETLGGIKSGSGDNVVSVDSDGEASVKSVNVNTLSQDEGDVLILNGGRCY